MTDELDGIRTTGAISHQARPEGVTYHDVTDPDVRASVVAHAIRLGSRPPVGQSIGFSSRPSACEIDDFEVSKMTPVGEKVWYLMIVTQADIDATHDLINAQKTTYKEASGDKVSQVLSKEKQG